MPTVEHNFEDNDVICLNSDDDDDEAEIDVGGPEAVVAKPEAEDMTWLTKLAGFARAEVEKQKQELQQATAAQHNEESSDDDIEIISSNITPKPMVVPVSIRVPKSLENKIRESLIENGGTNMRANKDLTKALETALGCNIRNFNFFLPPSDKPDSSTNVLDKSAESSFIVTKKETETKSTISNGVKPTKGENSRPSSKVARISPSSRQNLASQEELQSSNAAKPSKLPSHDDRQRRQSDEEESSTNNRRKSRNKSTTEEDPIALNSFYGFSSNDENGSIPDDKAPTKEVDDSLRVSSLPLFKDGRPTNGRMVCKKQAFYLAQQPKSASKAGIKSPTSKTSLPPSNKSQNTKSPDKSKKQKVTSSTNNDKSLTSPSDKSPKTKSRSPDKSSKKPKASASNDASLETSRSSINLRPKRHYPKPDDFYNDDDFLLFDDDEIYEPPAKTSVETQKVSNTSCEKRKPKPELKLQVAKKSSSKGPPPDEVNHLKSLLAEVTFATTDFLRNVDFRYSDQYKSYFISVMVFEELFVDFQTLLDSSKLMRIFGENIQEHFLFENWKVSHVSSKAAIVILSLLGKKPAVIFNSACQLSVVPNVRLEVLPVDFSNFDRVSSKVVRKSRQSSSFHPHCGLSKSYAFDKTVTAKIRPKYRNLATNLSVENETFSLAKDWKIENNQHDFVRPSEDQMCRRKRKLSNCGKQLPSDMESEEEPSKRVDSKVWSPVKMVGSRPVRKFPENWKIPSEFTVKQAAVAESAEEPKKTTPNVEKKSRFANIEMPTFTLGGLSQTLPSHIEGWFSNKLDRLKCLAELKGDSKNKTKYSNGFSASVKRLKFERSCTTDVKQIVRKQVSVSVGNIPLENIIELSDFKKKNAVESCNEPSFDHLMMTSSASTTTGTSTPQQQQQEQQLDKIPLRSDFSELLKVARKIEKISSQGFGKLPPKQTSSFLPPGWFRRIRTDSLEEEYVRVSDGLVVPTIVCAINRHLSDVASPQKNQKCARKSAKPMKLIFD